MNVFKNMAAQHHVEATRSERGLSQVRFDDQATTVIACTRQSDAVVIAAHDLRIEAPLDEYALKHRHVDTITATRIQNSQRLASSCRIPLNPGVDGTLEKVPSTPQRPSCAGRAKLRRPLIVDIPLVVLGNFPINNAPLQKASSSNS
jgi:hypothetical protein